eukprot:scaffold7158_cov16-Tisochrysis_lutea.AAC.1
MPAFWLCAYLLKLNSNLYGLPIQLFAVELIIFSILHILSPKNPPGRVEVEQLPTESIKRIKECYKQMRAAYSAAGAELQLKLQSAEASLQRNGAQSRLESCLGAGDGFSAAQ